MLFLQIVSLHHKQPKKDKNLLVKICFVLRGAAVCSHIKNNKHLFFPEFSPSNDCLHCRTGDGDSEQIRRERG